MAAGLYNFTIEQGATFRRTITWHDVDLTGFTARLHARRQIPDTDTVLDLASGNELTITPDNPDPDSTIEIELTDEETAALDFDTAHYDLELESAGGEVTRLLYGVITLSREVTR